jgi:spermidine synthase
VATLAHPAHAAVVWLDRWHAFVARRDQGAAAIVDVERGDQSEGEYLVRVARMTDDCDRVMILGPGDDRLAFGREYVAHHPREVVALDIETSVSASPAELFDRLRLLEGDERARPVG